MGKCASKCCFCVPHFKDGSENRTGGRNKFEPAIQFTITATPQKDGSKDEVDPDFVPPPQSNLGYEDELKNKEGLGDFDDILFGREDFDSKSLDEISLSKEMDNRSKEIMQSYQLRGSLMKEDNYSSKNDTFTRPTSSSEDSCLPESIPSTHPLPKGGDSESVISSESYDEEIMMGSRKNPGFIRDEDCRISSCHYKTEVIGEVKSVYSSDADSCGKVTTANLTLIDRCMGLELNENDDVLEMSSVRFVLGENNGRSASSSPASLDSFSLETVFPMSLGKNQLEISDEVQTRL